MTYTYAVDGSTVVIFDPDDNEANRIVVTPGDPNLSDYLAAACPEADSFQEV